MQKNNTVVLFDIDHTIFNTNIYRKNLFINLAKELGHDPNEFYEIGQNVYENIRKTTPYLTPELFLKNVFKHSKKATGLKKLNSVFWNKELYDSCVYPDVKKTFSYLFTEKVQIGIFSTGDFTHQRIKIASLMEYLTENHIYISLDKFKIIKDTLKIYKKYRTYIVDDYPQILEGVKAYNENVFTVFIKRQKNHPGLVIPDNFKPDATITTLSQLIDIIEINN